MMRGILLTGVGIAALISAIPAEAQNIVMRRPLNVSTAGVDWRVGEFTIFDGSGNVVQPENACGNYEMRRQVDCVRDGQVVNDSFCRDAGPRPASVMNEFLDTGCTYSWNAGGWVDPGPNCSNAEVQTQLVECRRDQDGVVVDDSLCGAGQPPSSRTVPDYSTCTYTWDIGPYQDPGPNCTFNEVQTRTVECSRDLDSTVVADSFCPSPKPTDTRTQPDFSSCIYRWRVEDWVDPGASCTDSETQTRAVFCERLLDNNPEPDSRCNPSTRPSSTRNVADYSGCSFSWQTGAWQDPGSSCGSETQTRTVTCERSDGTPASDSDCTETKPDTTQTVNDFSGCSFSWQTGVWSAWNSTCSANATRTRSVSCERQDGQNAPDSSCNPATRPTSSETASVLSGCGYQWITGGWQDPGASCTPSETQTRSVQCRRSDGVIVDDSLCGGGRPAGSQTVADYSGCQSGINLLVNWGAWSAYNSSCSDSATRSRTGTCLASGQPVASSVCTDRGLAVTQSESIAIYSGCSYSAGYGPWSECVNGTQSRSMTSCTNTTLGRAASLSECTSRGIPSTQSQACTPVQTIGRQCSPGTTLGHRYQSGWAWNGTGPTAFSSSGIYSSFPVGSASSYVNFMLNYEQVCKNAGGTCVEYELYELSEFGDITARDEKITCMGGGSTPFGTEFSDSQINGAASEIFVHRSNRP